MKSSDLLNDEQESGDKVDHDLIGKIAACLGLSVTSFAAMHAVIGLAYSPHLRGNKSVYKPLLFVMDSLSVFLIYVLGFLSSLLLYVTWTTFAKSHYGGKIDSYAKKHEPISWRNLPILIVPLVVIIIDRNFYILFEAKYYFLKLPIFLFSIVIFLTVGLRYSDRLISFAWLSPLRNKVILCLILLLTATSAVDSVEGKKSVLYEQVDEKKLDFCRNYPVDQLDFIDAKEQVIYKFICDDLLSKAYWSAMNK